MAYEIVGGKVVVTEARPSIQKSYSLEDLQEQLAVTENQISGLQAKKTELEEMISALQT